MKCLGLWTFHGVGRSTAEVDQGSDRASRGSSGFKLVLISESEGELKDYVWGLKGVYYSSIVILSNCLFSMTSVGSIKVGMTEYIVCVGPESAG